MADDTDIPITPTGNPVIAARAIMEARIPPALRSDDWDARWNELIAMAGAPIELRQIGLSGAPMVEEIRRAFDNGHLTAAECLAAIREDNEQ